MNQNEHKKLSMDSAKNQNRDELLKKDNLGTMSVPRLIVSLAVPAIISQMINAFYSIVDRIYISRIPQIGDMALTGVGICFPIIILVSAFSQLIGAGGATLASIELGKGNRRKSEEMLGSGYACLILIAITLTVIFQLTKYQILVAFGASDSTINYAVEYLSVYLLGTIFVETTLGLYPFITCQGKSRIVMLSILIGAVLNIILAPIFIFIFGLGVRGSAIATIISQAASSIWIVHFLISDKSSIILRRENLRLKRDILLSIMTLGISTFTMTFTECLINVVFNSGLQKYGGDYYVASMTIIQSVMQIVYIFSNGLTQGIQPIISFNYGAQQFDRVRKAYRIGFVTHITFASFMSTIIMLLPGFFASLFTTNREIVDIVVCMMPIFICGWGIFGIQSGAQCAFISLGQAKISFFLACLRKVILLIPLALILPKSIGVLGIYLAEPISDVISALAAGGFFILKINTILSKEPCGEARC